MTKIKAAIIDDLEESRTSLKDDLSNYCPDIDIVGEAEGVVTGAKLLKDINPDVLFLDIQMPDGSGFDLLEIIKDDKIQVIFTTASDEHAIKAFKFSAVDYLLKPIDPDELMEAVNKIESNSSDGSNYELLASQMEKKELNKIALHTLEKIHIKDLSEIVKIESDVNYSKFFFSDGSNLLVTKTLKEFDKMLSDHNFFRVHQSHLINGDFVKEYVKTDGGYLVMKDGSTVPVSTRKKHIVMDMIDKL